MWMVVVLGTFDGSALRFVYIVPIKESMFLLRVFPLACHRTLPTINLVTPGKIVDLLSSTTFVGVRMSDHHIGPSLSFVPFSFPPT